ncbi:hypothetical protein PFISCL1PPCAC_19269, partial [Pristionchus fissidentatus]
THIDCLVVNFFKKKYFKSHPSMRLLLLLSSLLYLSSAMNRHERKGRIKEEEIDYEEEDENDDEDDEDYENFDSKEEPSATVEWVPVMSRNLSGSVYDSIHSTDREYIRKISQFLNYSYHTSSSRDSSISPSSSLSFLSFSLLSLLLR